MFSATGPLPASTVPFAVLVDPHAPGVVYLGTTSGVLRSSDGGAHWSAFGTGLELLTVVGLAIDALSPATLYASTVGGGAFAFDLAAPTAGAPAD
jgi:hypothetical protein